MIKGLSEFETFKVIRPIIGDCNLENNIPVIRKTIFSDEELNNISLLNVKNLSKRNDNSNYIVSMFNYDKDLMKHWNNPLKRIPIFQTCFAVATPDFSLYPSMNPVEILHNTYMNRWLGVTWQNYNVTVIPTIGWAEENTFDICFSGVERGSTVIISTLGCKNNPAGFLRGFNEMKRRIEPSLIIVVGDIIDGMAGRFLHFKYSDSFSKKHIQLRMDCISPIIEIKEVS